MSPKRLGLLLILLGLLGWQSWKMYISIVTESDSKIVYCFLLIVSGICIPLMVLQSSKAYILSHALAVRLVGTAIAGIGLAILAILTVMMLRHQPIPFSTRDAVWISAAPMVIGFMVAMLPSMIKSAREKNEEMRQFLERLDQ